MDIFTAVHRTIAARAMAGSASSMPKTAWLTRTNVLWHSTYPWRQSLSTESAAPLVSVCGGWGTLWSRALTRCLSI